MVAVSKAVVDVDAVVIELLNTLAADHAVECLIRFDDFAVKAEVFKVDVTVVAYLEQVKHVKLRSDVTRLQAVTHQIEYHREPKEAYASKSYAVECDLKFRYTTSLLKHLHKSSLEK